MDFHAHPPPTYACSSHQRRRSAFRTHRPASAAPGVEVLTLCRTRVNLFSLVSYVLCLFFCYAFPSSFLSTYSTFGDVTLKPDNYPMCGIFQWLIFLTLLFCVIDSWLRCLVLPHMDDLFDQSSVFLCKRMCMCQEMLGCPMLSEKIF